MFYIGIDVGKFNHCACVTDSNGVIHVEPFFFDNNKDGFSLLLKNIQPYQSKNHLLGLESTGHYGDNLIFFLLDLSFNIGMINPISTDAQRKLRVRKTKNDKKDSLLICTVLHSKNYTTLTKNKFNLRAARELTRYHADLTEELNRSKNKLQKCIDILFPEFNSLFKSKYSRPYMALLREFCSAHNIANANLTHLKNVIKQNGSGRTIDLTAVQLRDIARNSIGQGNQVTVFELKHLIQNIDRIIDQKEEVDKKIEELASELNSPIFSIPGIGIYSGLAILSEIGDINDFSCAAKIIAFAGVDPAVYQSGNYNAPRTAISKRGSRYLRKVLYQCILTVCKYNSTFNTYYTLKRSQGKSHRCAQGHSVRKLIRVIFKLCSENIEFDKNVII